MKAFYLKGNGIQNMKLDEFLMPAIGSTDLLVKTMAISLNPVDVMSINMEEVRNGLFNPAPGEKVIGGWDLAGEVIQVGDSVKGYKIGDRVFGCIKMPGQGKVYAECVAAPADQVALMGDGVSFEAAAAASMAALTPYQALVTHGKISRTDKVLIHGAAGGVGHLAIQIAKSFGAYVIGTASSVNLDLVLSIGADQVIDYKKEKFEDIIKDADLVMDAINAENLLRSLDAVKPGGRVVSLIAPFEGEIDKKAKQKKITGIKMGVYSNGGDTEKIAKLLASGKVKPVIFQVFPFEDLPNAVGAMGKLPHGKIVVKFY